MMLKSLVLATAVVCALVVPAARMSDKVKPDLTGVKCMLMPKKEVKETFSVDYAGSKVYFCCKGCAGNFSKDPEKHGAAANKQLVDTKLFKQAACPISGGKLNDATEIEVEGTKVKFCCNTCKGKVEGEKDATAKSALVFAKDAFAKGFAKVEPKKE
jgi:YHS domain-containing protein